MQNRTVLGYEGFRLFRNEVSAHIRRYTFIHSPDYVASIKDTLNHLEIFCLLRQKKLAWKDYIDRYEILDVMRYDLSSFAALKNLTFSYYINGKKYIHYSLHKWLTLYDNFVLHQQLFKKIVTDFENLPPTVHDHKPGLFRALKRLQEAMFIQDRHPTKMRDLCYPVGLYSKETIDSYPSKTIQDVMLCRVECFDEQAEDFTLHRSVQDWIDIIWAEHYCNQIKTSIHSDLALFGQDQPHLSFYEDRLMDALARLKMVIKIKYEERDEWAQGTVESPYYYNEVINYNLGTKKSLLALRVSTCLPEGKYLHRSINDYLERLKAPRIAKSLFNVLYHEVMQETHHLQELAEKDTTEGPLREEILQYTYQLACTLNALYLAIEHTVYSSVNAGPVAYDFSTIGHLLQLVIRFEDGSEQSLAQIIGRGSYFTPHLLEKVESISVNYALLHSKTDEPVLMHRDMFSSIVKAKKLCALIETGNLDRIKALNPSAADVNLLIDLPLETIPKEFHSFSYGEYWRKLSIANVMKDIAVFSSTVKKSPILLYLGRYNALILAVCYRHYAIVEYFINTLKADPDIKGGRNNDYSARDCASFNPRFLNIKPPEPGILALLHPGFSANKVVIHGTYSARADEGYVEIIGNQECKNMN